MPELNQHAMRSGGTAGHIAGATANDGLLMVLADKGVPSFCRDSLKFLGHRSEPYIAVADFD